MSTIEGLLVRGIRSFSPQDRDEDLQIIKFNKPLTLIVGPNGSGKTTLIECLRYACTGDQPIGSKGSFIHDPKVSGETEVKAQVKLQFYDYLNSRVVVTRCLQATQKGKTVQCKTLDSTVQRKKRLADGSEQTFTISSKCAEIDKMMTEFLGVSSSVLSNVIFCHQEESSWPLSDGGTLKKKFDDIFDAAKYSKALEEIRKQKKGIDVEAKQFTVELKYLSENKEIAEKKEQELKRYREKSDVLGSKITTLHEKLQPVTTRFAEIDARYGEIHALESDIKQYSTQMNMLEAAITKLKQSLSEEFDGDSSELDASLCDFNKSLKTKEKSLEELRSRLTEIKAICDNLNARNAELRQEKGKLESRVKQIAEKTEYRNRVVENYAKTLAVQGFDPRFSDEDARRFISVVELKKSDVSKELDQTKESFDKDIGQLQTEIEEVLKQQSSLKSIVSVHQNSYSEKQLQINQTKTRMQTLEASQSKLRDVETNIRRAENELKHEEENFDLRAVKADLTKLVDKRASKEHELRKLQTDIRMAQKESADREKIELLKAERLEKDIEFKRLMLLHEDNFSKLFDDDKPPMENCRRTVDQYLTKYSREVSQIDKRLSAARHQLITKESSRKTLVDDLKQKEDIVKSFDATLSETLDEAIAYLDAKIFNLQDEISNMTGALYVYRKFTSKAKKEKCCPLCAHEFPSTKDLTSFVSKLEMQIAKLENYESQQQELQAKKEESRDLIQLQPQMDQTTQYKQETIVELKVKINVMDQQIAKLRNDVHKDDELLKEEKLKEDVAKSLQSDAGLLDSYAKQMRDYDERIEETKALLIGSSDSRSLNDLNNALDACQDELQMLSLQKEKLERKLNEHETKIIDLKQKLNKFQSTSLELQKGEQERDTLKGHIERLQSDCKRSKELMEEKEKELVPLELTLNLLREDKARVTDEQTAKLNGFQNRIILLQSISKEVLLISEELDKLTSESVENALENVRMEILDVERELREKTAQSDSISHDCRKLQTEMDSQQSTFRNLQDNKTLREDQKRVVELAKKRSMLEQQRGSFQVDSLIQERSKLNREQQYLSEEVAKIRGTIAELQSTIKRTELELNSDHYADIAERHKVMLIKARTAEIAGQDLSKFYDAMDAMIMKFHVLKMEEINRNIRDLWHQVYRGSDIEYIEIKADKGADGGADARRCHNYKVVMFNRGTELEMRGRCSAGQKVLASLIIRIALAESFCLKCGILALDEPTTNLDRENIESLAEALIRLIRCRAVQKSFQLVIITHDQDFVEHLLRDGLTDSFYKVGKDHDGYSRLTLCRNIEELRE